MIKNIKRLFLTVIFLFLTLLLLIGFSRFTEFTGEPRAIEDLIYYFGIWHVLGFCWEMTGDIGDKNDES